MEKTANYINILLASVPGIMFFVLPIPGMEFSFSWMLASLWIAGLLFVISLKSWWYRLFFVWAFIRTATLPPVMESYLELLFIALFLAAAEKFETIKTEWTLNAIAAAAIGLLGWMVLQQFRVLTPHFGWQSTGPFNPALGGIFLAMCLPAFFRARWLVMISPIMAGIVISRSTTGMLAAVVAIAIFAGMTYKSRLKMVWPLALTLIIFGSIWLQIDPLTDTVHSIRWPTWRRAIIAANVQPTGRGLGSWKDIFPLMASGDSRLGQVEKKGDGLVINSAMTEAHNEYVNALFELGYPGLILIVCFLISMGLQLYFLGGSPPVLPACGLAALLVGCFGFSVLHYAPPALVGCAWLGMWAGEVQSSKLKEENR